MRIMMNSGFTPHYKSRVIFACPFGAPIVIYQYRGGCQRPPNQAASGDAGVVSNVRGSRRYRVFDIMDGAVDGAPLSRESFGGAMPRTRGHEANSRNESSFVGEIG